MFIEPQAPNESLRSSGARYFRCLDDTLRSYGAPPVIAVALSYKYLAALRPGPTLSATFRVRTLFASARSTVGLHSHAIPIAEGVNDHVQFLFSFCPGSWGRVLHHLSQKSIPKEMNPFLATIGAYLIGTIVCAICAALCLAARAWRRRLRNRTGRLWPSASVCRNRVRFPARLSSGLADQYCHDRRQYRHDGGLDSSWYRRVQGPIVPAKRHRPGVLYCGLLLVIRD